MTPQGTGVLPFDPYIPIKIGDRIGLDYGNTFGFYYRTGGGPDAGRLFNPALPPGSTRTPTSATVEEILINADIEPTSALATVAAIPKKKGKIRLSMQVPNPGALIAGDKADQSFSAVASAKKKKKKPKLLKRTSTQAGAPVKSRW